MSDATETHEDYRNLCGTLRIFWESAERLQKSVSNSVVLKILEKFPEVCGTLWKSDRDFYSDSEVFISGQA